MSNLKQLFCMVLSFVVPLMLFTGCGSISPSPEKNETEQVVDTATEIPTPALGISFDFENKEYYLWEDGIATDSEQYDASSNLVWEKDTKTLELVVKNTSIDIIVACYAYRSMPNLVTYINNDGINYYLWDDGLATKTEEYNEESDLRWSDDNDTYRVFDQNNNEIASYTKPELRQKISNGNVTYYLWDVTEEIKNATQGICTTTEEYNEDEGLRWTQPWEGRYIIYNGDYTNGYVVYSEFACSYCGVHKIYYCRIAAEGENLVRYYFCSNCNTQYESNHQRCPKCQSYWCYKGAQMCDHCWLSSY